VRQRGHRETRGLYFILRRGKQNSSSVNRSFVHDGLVSVVKSVELVSDTVSCIGLLAIRCHV
jgi:hypothetical protein